MPVLNNITHPIRHLEKDIYQKMDKGIGNSINYLFWGAVVT